MLKSTMQVTLSGFSTIVITGISLVLGVNPSQSLTFTQVNTPIAIDFTGFTGAGFAPTPGAGQLSSNNWAITGLSDGTLDFGDTQTMGDFARGTSSGGVSFGGIYAFDVGGGNIALGVQPSAMDFTPGTLILRLMNGTGVTVTDLEIGYIIYNNNDENRSNSFNFSYSLDHSSYVSIPGLNYTSPEAAGVATWVANPRSTTLTGLTLAPGSNIYLRWNGADVSGADARDEFALDDIIITPIVAVPYEFETGFSVVVVGGLLMFRRWKKRH